MNFQKRMQACQDEMMTDNESQSSEDSYFIRRKQIKLGEKKWALPYSLKLLFNGDEPNDQVSGYSLENIQKIMKGVTSIEGFEAKVKRNLPSGVTDYQIKLLFQTFRERWRE